jgi:hypothetical protein
VLELIRTQSFPVFASWTFFVSKKPSALERRGLLFFRFKSTDQSAGRREKSGPSRNRRVIGGGRSAAEGGDFTHLFCSLIESEVLLKTTFNFVFKFVILWRFFFAVKCESVFFCRSKTKA